jgi:putative oxidoreductase
MAILTKQQMQFTVGQTSRPYVPSLDLGLLIMRIGIGAMFMAFGIPKLLGGPAMWAQIGGAMKSLHAPLPAEWWGLCAGLSEGVGGLFIVLGLLFRPVAATLAFTMVIAAITMLRSKGFFDATHSIDMAIVFLGLTFTGAGWYSLDRKLCR